MFLVRHGETQANLNRIYHGRFDSPLTERGVGQAQAIGRYLAASPVAGSLRIISSPQPRAHRTAEIIRDCLDDRNPAPITLDERLCEVSIGSWEGRGHKEIAALAPGTFDGDGRHVWCFCAPDGETYDEFSARAGEWLRETGDDPSLIVVTHGIVGRVLRGLYASLPRLTALSLPVPQNQIFHLSRGAVEEIIIEGAPTIVRLTKVMPMPDYHVLIEFDDGVAGMLDLRDKLPDSIPQDEVTFQQVTIDDFGAISWPVGSGLRPKPYE